MTPHTFALHTNPALRAIMSDDTPPAQRLRLMAQQLQGMLDADAIDPVDLRGLVFGLDAVAEQLEQKPVGRRKWRWW